MFLHVQYSFLKQVENDQNPTTTLVMFLSFFISSSMLLLLYKLTRRRRSKLNLPPSPPKLPIIGNIHQIGIRPHHSFQALSQKYGPLMFLRLGQLPLLVVSSADMAREVMQTHDVVFASRQQLTSQKTLIYGCKDVAFASYGEAWRQKKKLCVVSLLSVKKVQSFQFIIEEEVASLVDNKIRKGKNGYTVNLSEMLIETSYNIVSRCIFGRKNDDEDYRLRELVREIVKHFPDICVGDLFPLLAWVDVLNGKIKKYKTTFGKVDAFFDDIIAARRMMERGNHEMKDFLDILLQNQDGGMSDFQLTQDDELKAILLDMFLAGTDTIATTVEWAMVELMKNPGIMKKAQEEVRIVVGNKTKIQECDMKKMEYMKCIIKETLRLHPPLPLLVARETTSDVKLGGYDIPKKTMVFVNVWAIQREPELWEMPEQFLPERFENNKVNFDGLDFQFLPFGSGRRKCPGMTFGVTTVEYMLSNLLHWFDWKLPTNCLSLQDLDMTEKIGVAGNLEVPLSLQAIPYNKFQE